MTDSNEAEGASRVRFVSSELIQLVPKVLWFLFAVAAFALVYRPVMGRLDRGEVTKVGFALFQIEFAKREFEKAARLAPRDGQASPRGFEYFSDRIERSSAVLLGAKVLWVDDKQPAQNFAERRALSSLGLNFDTARSTDEAQQLFDLADRMGSPYDLIISDLGRDPAVDPLTSPCFPLPNSPEDAGCKLLEVVRGRYGGDVPFIFYTRDGDKLGTPAGAFGATNHFDDLVALVLDATERRKPSQIDPPPEDGKSK